MEKLTRLLVLVVLTGCGAEPGPGAQSLASGSQRMGGPVAQSEPERPADAQSVSDAGTPDVLHGPALPPDADQPTQRDTAPGPAILTITPSEYTFSAVGQRTTFVVRNIGGTGTELIATAARPTADYRVDGSTCTKDGIAPGASCQVVVVFVSTKATPPDGMLVAYAFYGAPDPKHPGEHLPPDPVTGYGPTPPPVSALLRYQPR